MTVPKEGDKFYWDNLVGTVESVEEDGYTVVYRVKHYADSITYRHTSTIGSIGFETSFKANGIPEKLTGETNTYAIEERK